jgi:[FeFe] hydrogenase H-cluster maturation GTPase HydF
MGMNDTPSANRIHIGFFGRRNAGKSSLVNAVTGQSLSVVSEVAGTTTDPVHKSMELLPLGPVVITDTAGIDDSGHLGELRVEKTRNILKKTDVAVLVVDGIEDMGNWETELIRLFKENNINFIVAYNKCDLVNEALQKEIISGHGDINALWVSAKTGAGIENLKNRIGQLAQTDTMTGKLVGDLINSGDTVVLVVPIDKAAPKGRLILPQQQVIRDVLESGGVSIVCRDTELSEVLTRFANQVSLVITDSQVFGKVMHIVPEDVPLTSFSILMARFKGQLQDAVNGAYVLDKLKKTGGRVLICEGCTHHRQCDDIGTVKLPGWIRAYTGADIDFDFVSGGDFPEDLKPYQLVVHCGGCMLTEREMKNRQRSAKEQGVAITNYGTAIAHMNGILERSLRCLTVAGHDKSPDEDVN